MFEKTNVAVRISNITHRQMEKDDAEIPLVELTCEINPFTAELAGDLHDFMKRTLYTAAGVEVNSLLGGASFALELRPQTIVVRMAPDQKKDSFTIDEAKIEHIRAKRSKKSTAWTLEFKVTCSPASEHQLAQIAASYCKTRYLTMADAAACLFDKPVDETPRIAGRVADEPVDDATEPTTAH